MKDNYLFYLKITYAFVFGMILFLIAIPFHAKIRAILLLIAFIPVIVTHIIISLSTNAKKINKIFIFLSFLWGTKFIVFVTNEGLNFFFQKKLLVLDLVDLFLLLIIALLISFSFIIKIPFWYMKTENRSSIGVGISLLIFSGWVTWQIIFSLIDYIKFSRNF